MNISQFKKERNKEFEKKFVVSAGTKRVKRVGHYTTPISDVPAAAYWDDVKVFFDETIDILAREMKRDILNYLLFVFTEIEPNASKDRVLECIQSLKRVTL